MTKLQETIDELLALEAAWLYLEPIFKTGDDVALQLPVEAVLFDEMDQVWRSAIFFILEHPAVLSLSEHPAMLKSLIEANTKLELVRKGLAGYLDAKRNAFPRFNFISDAELLEILANTTDPTNVQPYLLKCFSGVAGLVFSRNSDDGAIEIVAALDTTPNFPSNGALQTGLQTDTSMALEGERLDFAYLELNMKPIRPSTTSCDVERWLGEVEKTSRRSLALAIETSIKEMFSSTSRAITLRSSRAQDWQEQILVVAHHVAWTQNVEDSLRRAAAAAAEVAEARLLNSHRSSSHTHNSSDTFLDPNAALKSLLVAEQSQLEETIRAVQATGVGDNGNTTSRIRASLGVLIVLNIHQRDVTCALVDSGVFDVADFEWLVQLRYYVKTNDEDAHASVPSKIESHCVHHCLPYAYEYLGGGGKIRLAITPVTSRCFRAFFCALRTHAGCTFRCFTGSGASATLVGFTRALATHTVTLNCVASLECAIVAMLLRGAAASGSWMCLEGFSRLPPEVISVTMAEISENFVVALRDGLNMSPFQTHGALSRGMTRTFVIECDSGVVDVKFTSDIREIFRPVSLGMPDLVSIGEILLCAHGSSRAQAHFLATHVSQSLRLCAELLSGREAHYKFGLRLMNTVIVTVASTMRRQGCFVDGVETKSSLTDAILMRALIDIVESGIALRDIELFKEILKSVFRGVPLLERDLSEDFVAAFREACKERKQLPLDGFCTKVMHLYDAITSWPGAGLIGRSFSGKTSTWKNLITTIGLLKPQNKVAVASLVTYPGALTLDELYGTFHPESREWTDGILSSCYRELSQRSVRDVPRKRQFLVLDGAVDASWTEQLHGALDDSATLCLTNGEFIHRSNNLSVLFESESLYAAAPTVVSRISVVSFADSYMKWRVLYDTWISLRDVQGVVAQGDSTFAGDSQKVNTIPTAESTRSVYQPDLTNDQKAVYLSDEECRLLEALAEWLVEPALAFVQHELHGHVEPLSDESLVQSLLRLLDGLLHICLRGAAPAAGSADVKERRQRRQHIECAFLWALLWSVGASGPETAQTQFGVFLRDIISDSRVIRTRYMTVHESLTRRGWCVPEFTGVFSGTLQLPLPSKGSAHDYEYRPRDNETGAWRMWTDALQAGGQYSAPEISGTTVISELLVPTIQTVQSGLLLDLMMRAGGYPALFCGPPGSGKTVHARAALARLPRKKHRTAYLKLHATTSARSFSHALLGRLVKRRKGVFGPPINQKAVVFVDDINLPDVRGPGKTQMPLELLRGLIENGSWFETPDAKATSSGARGRGACHDSEVVKTGVQVDPRNTPLGKPILQRIEDTSIWASTNGRAAASASVRLLRHFTIIHTSDPSDTTLTRVYTVLVESHFASQSFASDIVAATAALVAATIWTLREVVSELRPTPNRQLCIFDTRNSARCIQGVLRCRADDDFDKSGLARLWVHEVLRTYSDRLLAFEDQEWMVTHIQTAVLRNFKLDTDTLITDLQQLIFTDFHNPLERGVYLEVRDPTQLYDALDRAQDEFCNSESMANPEVDKVSTDRIQNNADNADLVSGNKRVVVFPLVAAQISRLVRAFGSSGSGHALLGGASGTGRRAVARLAAHVSGCALLEPWPYAQFDSLASWRNELKLALRRAGIGDVSVCLLIADTHVLSLGEILASICDVMATGQTPGLFLVDERAEIAEEMRSRMRRQRGAKNAETMSHDDLFSMFSERVRVQLHIALVVSLDKQTITRANLVMMLRRFPALVSHFMCVDHHASWQDDALSAVAESFLGSSRFVIGTGLEPEGHKKTARDVPNGTSKELSTIPGARPESTTDYAEKRLQVAAVALCRQIHTSVVCRCDYRVSAPTSTFLELLECLRANLDRARMAIGNRQTKYGRALDVAHHAQRAIATIGDGIDAARAVLDATNFEAVVFDTELSHKKSISGVESKYAEVEADAEALVHEEAAARVLAEEFEREIAQAQPAFDEAYAALEALSVGDLSELRALPRPPIGAKPILEAVCILLGEKPVKVADPADPTRRVLDFWGAAQQRVLIGEPPQLVSRLRGVDHDKISSKAISKLKDTYIGPGATHEASFVEPDMLDGFIGATVSSALCRWVRAASSYEQTSRTAQPKRDAAARAQSELEKSLEALERKRNEINGVEAELADIAAGRDATRGRCDELQETILINSRRLERAKSLLDALVSGGELERWETLAREASTRASSLVADALLSAGALTYLAPLDSSSRYLWLVDWVASCKRRDLPVSAEWSVDASLNHDGQPPQPALVECCACEIT